jgi:CheY-like chemotaxis protein
MFDHDDLKWIATTATDLNSALQQISRYADLACRHKGEHNYIELLGERVELASKKSQALFDRVTSKILEKTGATAVPSVRGPAPSPPSPFTVLPPPVGNGVATSMPARAPARLTETLSKVTAAVSQLASPARKVFTSPAAVPIPADIPVKNPKGNRELLLLIEDEGEVAELAAEMLATQGYKVIVVNDGFAALKIYERIGRQIALVILDFFLPIMDGDAVFDELRSLNPDINVVLSSGFAEQSKISAMLGQGLRGFIPKPYTSEKLIAQVRSILDAGRQVSS